MLIIKTIEEFCNEQSLDFANLDVLKRINTIRRNIGLDFNLEDGPWIAGGAVLKLAEGRDLGKRDFDLFFSDKKQFKHATALLNVHAESEEAKYDRNKDDGYIIDSDGYGHPIRVNVFETSKALTYNLKTEQVQLIRRAYYTSIYSLLGDFDFSICQFVTDGKKIAYTKQALIDMKNKHLRIQYTHRNSTLIKRFYKYMASGYTPAPGEVFLMHEIVREDPLEYAIDEGQYG